MGVRSGPRIYSESREEGGVLLIHSDTTDGSTSFVDSSPSRHTLAASGNPRHETDYSKFGATSIFIPNAYSDTVGIAAHSDFEFTGDFTIDMWVNVPSGGDRSFYVQSDGSYTYFAFNYSKSATQFNLYINTGGPSQTPAYDLVGWNHVAWIRSGDQLVLYVNGTAINTVTTSATLGYAAGNQTINRLGGGASTTPHYCDEVRISKGIARWTKNFKPPHRPYATRDLVLHLDAANAHSYAGEPTRSYGAYYYEPKLDLDGDGTPDTAVGGKFREGVDSYASHDMGNAEASVRHPNAKTITIMSGGTSNSFYNGGVGFGGQWQFEAHAHWVFDKILKKPVIECHPVDSAYGQPGYGGWRAKSLGVGSTWTNMGISSGTSYTISWLQWADQPGAYWAVGLYATRASDGAWNFYDGLSGSETGQIVPRKWERKSKTYTASSGYNFGAAGSLYCYGQYTPAVYGTVKITDIQIETKSYKTPFVEGVPRTVYDAVRDGDPATNDQSGWRDLSGQGNHGTIANASTGVAHYRDGDIIRLEGSDLSPYLDFDGSSDLITTPFGNGLNPTTTLLSYALWVYPDTASGGQMFMVQSSWSASARAYFGHTGGVWAMGIQASGWGAGDGGLAVVASAWHHIVIVFDGSYVKWYQNGNHIFDKAYTSYAFDSAFTLGNSGYPWNGKIATCAVHKAALTHAQIKDMYNSQRSRFGK